MNGKWGSPWRQNKKSQDYCRNLRERRENPALTMIAVIKRRGCVEKHKRKT